MTMGSVRTRLGTVCAAVWLGVFLCLPAAAAERIKATYNFVWNGFIIYTAVTDVTSNGLSYDVAITSRTRGALRVFVKGESLVTAKGRREAGTAMAGEYRSEGRWGGDSFFRSMRFGRDGRLQDMQEDWPEEWLQDYPREPVPETLQTAPDPTALIIRLLDHPVVARAAEQPQVLRSFDGRTVSDVTLSCDEGETVSVLEESRFSPVAGEAVPCRLTLALVAGHLILSEEEKEKRARAEEKRRKRQKREGRSRRRKAEDDTPDPQKDGIVMWFQDVFGDGRMLPVRAETETEWGTVRMYLKDFSREDGPPMAVPRDTGR
ncbi:DUF3108 domain-containing protein [Eilatimonas milleporae]|uniref:Uncharacterized protein DUF3108 n=1 Tax=Eilatimonas milleporae TaxID=911205 RepID=A0A3M0CXK9_9PROT|nr:DUF3108 domain-containing protein [Eilatimonas milleporae]RMB12329.1 uncharacterized protein DUF3108 [Eilatimonas milleporae]